MALPWYKEGLRFKCTECGGCCTGSPGYVWTTPDEMQEIAEYMEMPLDKFTRTYIREAEGRHSLIEKPGKSHDCIFLKDKKCNIYPVRPGQCRTFPWWLGNLTDKEAWDNAAKGCEGINQGEIISYEEIQNRMKESN